MARWEPNARARLQAAAMELFEEHGYDRTTVGDIAARADLTERTFFRHFTDKREVLFSGTEELETLIASEVAAAPKAMSPFEVVVTALTAWSPFLETRRAHAKKRQALIAAHAELRERELMKSTRLGSTLTASLRTRGIPEASTTLLARTGMTLFANAFERWIADSKKRDFAHHMHESVTELRTLMLEPGPKLARKPSSRRSRLA